MGFEMVRVRRPVEIPILKRTNGRALGDTWGPPKEWSRREMSVWGPPMSDVAFIHDDVGVFGVWWTVPDSTVFLERIGEWEAD